MGSACAEPGAATKGSSHDDINCYTHGGADQGLLSTGFSDPEQYSFKSRRGLDRDVVQQISAHKNEPEWMVQFRLKALDICQRKPMPTWPSADLSEIDFDNMGIRHDALKAATRRTCLRRRGVLIAKQRPRTARAPSRFGSSRD
jgi:hypothetical protein